MSCIFIFFRDLRLNDNLTWNHCCRNFQIIHPVFLFQPGEWKSSNQRQFLVECLADLNRTLHNKLSIITFPDFYKIMQSMPDNIHIAANINYEVPGRYDRLKRAYKWIELDDAALVPISAFRHKPYQKFTPFYQYMTRTHSVKKPESKVLFPRRLSSLSSKRNNRTIPFQRNEEAYVRGGYTNALRQLQKFIKTNLKEYEKNRNYFARGTSYLSAYLSLNVISIRQVYHATKSSEAFVRELFWREFYMHVIHFFPSRISDFSVRPALSLTQQKKWKQWKDGETGVELVDACMNQLNTTGYMHNRGRMIVASYLVKNMKIPFQYGEEYFSRRLVDHNTPSNNGGWQWVNGTGVDAQPRYQKFNPDIQLRKYDPSREYVDRWLIRKDP